MLLRNHVEWALHCCGILGAVPKGKYLATKDLAEFHGIPKEYLSKALQALSRAGILENALGPTGGYRLAKPPDSISFLDIVEAIEGKGPAFRCTEIRKNNPCKKAGQTFTAKCTIAHIMLEAEDAWRAHLANTSLADLGVMLGTAVPGDLLARSHQWIQERV